MSADVLDFAEWRSRLRAETQPAPEPEPALSPGARRALRLAGQIFDRTIRSAARYGRTGRYEHAEATLNVGYTDLRALARAYPMPVIIELMQIIGDKRRKARRAVRKVAP